MIMHYHCSPGACTIAKQFDEGISVIQDAIRLDPSESFYYYLHGFGHYQKDNSFLAIDNLTTAIQLNPLAC